MTHWQHLAATPEAVDRAVQLKEAGSISPHDIRFLRWMKESKVGIVTVGRVLKDYFKADFRDSWRYQEAKTLLESLAFCGYLLRGRQHANLRDPRAEGNRRDFAHTTYRLSKKPMPFLEEDEPCR